METLSIILPVRGTITGRFGEVYNAGTANAYQHRGLDIGAPEGTLIVAPCDGEVVDFFNDGSFGPYAICLYHPRSDLYLLMAHGRRSFVSVGQRVQQGQRIGEVGSLGASTGAHCHFQICVRKTFPVDIAYSRDPLLFLQEDQMEPYRLSLIAIANDPDYTRTVASYDHLATVGMLAQLAPFPGDGGIGDMNAFLMRQKGLMWIAASDKALDAYHALGGTE